MAGTVRVDLSMFRPLLEQALEPRESRKRRQSAEALSQLERLNRLAQNEPEETKELLYAPFHRAYGMTEVPTLRRLFGEKPEPLLPAPGPGVALKMLPSPTPTPLLHPSHEKEIRERGVTLGLPEERVKQTLARKVGFEKTPEETADESIQVALNVAKKIGEQPTNLQPMIKQLLHIKDDEATLIAHGVDVYTKAVGEGKKPADAMNLVSPAIRAHVADAVIKISHATAEPEVKAPTRDFEEKEEGGVTYRRRTQFNPKLNAFEILPGAQWVRTHEPRETEAEKVSLHAKNRLFDVAHPLKEEKAEKEYPARVNLLRETLLRRYLNSPTVWNTTSKPNAHQQAVDEVRASGRLEDAYYLLSETQRATFEGIIAEAGRLGATTNSEDAISTALTNLQRRRPGVTLPTYKEESKIQPPTVRPPKTAEEFLKRKGLQP